MKNMINIKDIKLKSKLSIAYDSPDHINPLGTKQDNSRNFYFNRKAYILYKDTYENSQLKVLDLGCSGGGFVRDCINDGCFAMGLDGSDYSKKMKRAEWGIIPEFLRTSDITKDFSILHKGDLLKFDLITAWEVLEHLKQKDIKELIKNVKKHLSSKGIFVGSVSNMSSKCNGVELHQTQKDKEWWISKFEKEGLVFREDLIDFFNGKYIRGRKQTAEHFHIILSFPDNNSLNKDVGGIKNKLFERWAGSKFQKFIKFIVNGGENE